MGLDEMGVNLKSQPFRRTFNYSFPYALMRRATYVIDTLQVSSRL